MAFTLEIGADAPPFELMGTDDKIHRLWDYDAAPFLVVAFTCNHCPYVIGNESRERAFADKYTKQGMVYVAINSNDTKDYPTDDFPHMKQRAADLKFTWDYLHDSTQEVAKKYGAIKTPHFFLFDSDRKLRYVGRMDDSPRDITKATTHELADAMDDLLAMRAVRVPATEAIGCTVKWKGKPPKFIPTDVCDLQ
jgi:peroxiredoxin